MELILCFGVVCHLMMIFANSNNTYISQGKLVSRYIALVDPENILLYADKEGKDDAQIKEIYASLVGNQGGDNKTIGHDSSRISKIMTGQELFRLSDKLIVNSIDISKSADLFKTYMSDLFSSENKCLLILAILDIIKDDKYINSPNSKSFGRFIDQSSDKYVFPEFMIRTLLYTAHNNIDEDEQLKCVRNISMAINGNKKRGKAKYSMSNSNILTEHINKVKDKYTSNTYTWDEETQTLTIIDKPATQSENSGMPENVKNNENNQLSSLGIPEECKSCRYCKNIEINEAKAKDTANPCLGRCLVFKKDVLKTSKVCDSFSPNYSAMTLHMLKGELE